MRIVSGHSYLLAEETVTSSPTVVLILQKYLEDIGNVK